MFPYKVAFELYGILGIVGWRRVALSVLDDIEFKARMRRLRKETEAWDKFGKRMDEKIKEKK